MNIRQKAALVIALSVTISAALNFGVLRLAVFPSFVELNAEIRSPISTAGERRGSGLHWSANSKLALGGRLYAESLGIGHGATVHLILPVLRPAMKRAA
jgi:hypothetical protein